MFEQQRIHLIRQAEAYDLKTKAKGQRKGALGDSGIKVLRVILFRFMDRRKGQAWPSYDAIHRATGLARQTIANALKALKAAGFLLVTKRAGWINGRLERETNLYRMPTEPPAPPPDDSLVSRRQPQTQGFVPLEQLFPALASALRSMAVTIGIESLP